MNLKMRLERLCDAKSWARLHFADGTALTGRLLRLGHDYVELECYGESDHPTDRDYAKRGAARALEVHHGRVVTVRRRRTSPS